MTPQPPGNAPVGIKFHMDQILCHVHKEPFLTFSGDIKPEPYVAFQKLLLQYIEDNKGLAAEAGGRHDNIPVVLNIRPFCCRLTMQEMLAFYEASLDPYMVRCVACGQAAAGGEYTLRNHWGRPKGQAYFCYACWLRRGLARQN